MQIAKTPGISEDVVVRIWHRQLVRPEKLATSTGEKVRVIYPGELNDDAGPDFRHASLEIEGAYPTHC